MGGGWVEHMSLAEPAPRPRVALLALLPIHVLAGMMLEWSLKGAERELKGSISVGDFGAFLSHWSMARAVPELCFNRN